MLCSGMVGTTTRPLSSGRTWNRPAIACALALALVPLACRRGVARPGEGRGILLIAVDALRADHLSCNGYDRTTSPTLDTMVEAGVSFRRNYTTAPWNLPATASLLTGCDPYVSRRMLPKGLPSTIATRWHIPDLAPRLAQQFLRAGWQTAAFVDHANVAAVHGFGSGFQTYETTAGNDPEDHEALGMEGLAGPLVQWMRSRGRDENWFAFLHLHDLERIWQNSDPRWDTTFEPRPELSAVPPVGNAEHIFHAIPRARWSGGMTTLGEYEARYDGALLRLDGQFRRLFNRMAQVGLLVDTTICVVGTHGLGFGEAGLILDHGTLDPVDLHVPWILHPAGGKGFATRRRIDELSSLLDVAPTLLDLFGIDVPPAMHGVSFAGLLRDPDSGRGPPRDHVVARGAFQEGYAVMGPGWTLELLQPWRVDSDVLAVSWYGHGAPFPQEARIELRPQVGAKGADPVALDASQREELANKLCSQGQEWLKEVEGLRASLQTVDWLTRAGFDVEPDVTVLGPCVNAPQGSH
jgi:arylsulfatase A-like enzyme